MEYTRINKDNIDTEHICCAISNNKDIQVASKKAWLLDRFEDGLQFVKSTERGKCFIEYIPADKAWVPVEASNYIFIDCFWVSGSLKGHGYSNDLLNICIEDAKNGDYDGLCVLSSEKKMAFLSDPKYLKYKGFEVTDRTDAGITLMYLPLKDNAVTPRFCDNAKQLSISDTGFVLYYTNQCPFTAKYVPIIERLAKEENVPFKSVHIETMEEARKVPCPVTTYALFINGKFVSNEILSEKKFLKLAEDYKRR